MARLEWTKMLLGALGGTIVLAVGVVQYVMTSSLSVRQPYLEKQTDMCLAAAEHAARLATTRDPAQWQRSREEFWMLYWGPLAVVEEAGTESEVARAMQAFGDKLKGISPSSPTLPLDGFAGRAIDIAHKCRDLLQSKWRTGIMGWLDY